MRRILLKLTTFVFGEAKESIGYWRIQHNGHKWIESSFLSATFDGLRWMPYRKKIHDALL
jgi:hypothetical protein